MGYYLCSEVLGKATAALAATDETKQDSKDDVLGGNELSESGGSEGDEKDSSGELRDTGGK